MGMADHVPYLVRHLVGLLAAHGRQDGEFAPSETGEEISGADAAFYRGAEVPEEFFPPIFSRLPINSRNPSISIRMTERLAVPGGSLRLGGQ